MSLIIDNVLPKEDLFNEIDEHLINDVKPSMFIQNIDNSLFYETDPFIMLSKLKNVKQSKIYHPEGDVFTHTMLVVDEAAKYKHKSSDSRAFIWAALLHDIGKSVTTQIKKGKITAYEHDIAGQKMATEFLEYFTDDTKYIEKVSYLVRYHMQLLFVVKDMPYADITGMKLHTDINDVAMLALCDRLGRLNVDEKKENENIRIFLKKVKKVRESKWKN